MRILLIGLLLSFTLAAYGQRSDKLPRYFGEPSVSDSASTIIIPIRYNAELLSANKIALWSDFYSNVLFYDFKADTYKKLFEKDTYIQGFIRGQNAYNRFERDHAKLEMQAATGFSIL